MTPHLLVARRTVVLPSFTALLAWASGCSSDTSAASTGTDAGDRDAMRGDGGSANTGSGGAPAGGNSAGGGNESGGANPASSGAGSGGVNPANGGASQGTDGAGPGNGGASPGTGGSAGGQAVVRVVGRTDGDTASPRFEWSGVSIQARFQGTSAAADIDGGDNNYFEVVVDGQVKPKVATTAGRRKVDLVTGLPDAAHDLVMWRLTEADNFSPSQFFGLDLGGGTLLPISEPAHKIEVIGDSITCGYGDEGNGPSCPFSFDTENNYVAYGSVAARALGADLHTECWSGKGMYRNNGGDMTDTMPTLFDRTIPTDASSQWDFSWIPDAVVINLGTNDFAQGDPGPGFVTAYEDFVAKLRTHYPNAYVFVMIGPMTGGSDLTTARGYLDQVVQARKGAGDDRISQVSIDAQDGTKNRLGCDWHPSIATHALVGQTLAAAVKSALGW